MNSVQLIIDKYYPAASPLRDIYLRHSEAVTRKALEINAHMPEKLDEALVEAAAMLHDIGIFMCNAPEIECNGKYPYICHGYLGADLLRKEGFDERIARVAERHTGTGITAEEINGNNMPLPPERSYMPESKLEKLICYSDKFFSKSGTMKEKPIDNIISGLQRHGEGSVERFLSLKNIFEPAESAQNM